MNEHLDPTDKQFSKEDNEIDKALRPISFDDFAGPHAASIEDSMTILRSIFLHHQYDPDTHVEDDNNNGDDINVDIDSNSIRGRRRKRNLESKIEALEQKLNDVIDSLNEKQTNSKLKDGVQDEQLNGKEEEEEETHKK